LSLLPGNVDEFFSSLFYPPTEFFFQQRGVK
jgi:hypothetical protein